MMDRLRKEVEEQLSAGGVVPEDKIVAGVSGGPDSMALIHILREIIPLGKLVVGHLNHKLRPEADTEARYVRRTAESWGIPIVVAEQDVLALAKEAGKSVEEAARQARYEFLLSVANDSGARFIAVAHHADDQVETVFLNLLRGSGLTGLRGMETVRNFPGQPIKLIRPLLFTWREEILNYCDVHGLQPMHDSSNEELAYRRNWLRHEILPRLSQMNPGFENHIQQLAQLVSADEAYLAQQSKEAFEDIVLEISDRRLRLDRARWRNLSLSLQRRILRMAVHHFQGPGIELSFRTIEQAWDVAQTGSTGAQSFLPGEIVLQVGYDDLTIEPVSDGDAIGQPQLNVTEILPLTIPGSIQLKGDWRLTAEHIKASFEEIRNNKNPWLAFVDVGDKAVLYVRTRKAGERFQPLGMDGRSISLQDYMVNIKLPAEFRKNWPIVATKAHPVWLVGYRIDERGKVTEQSGRIVQLHCKRTKNEALSAF